MDLKVESGCIQEDKGLGWGKFLPVQSVQEIVRNESQSVPERYLKLVSAIFPASPEIPIVNFSLLANGDEHGRRKLDFACQEWGIFQLTNHSVEEEVLQKMKVAVVAFFELPLKEKLKYAMAANDIQGYGQAYIVSKRQKLDWCPDVLNDSPS